MTRMGYKLWGVGVTKDLLVPQKGTGIETPSAGGFLHAQYEVYWGFGLTVYHYYLHVVKEIHWSQLWGLDSDIEVAWAFVFPACTPGRPKKLAPLVSILSLATTLLPIATVAAASTT